MIRHIETFFVGRGYREIGSDALLDNLEFQAAHVAWGFSRPNESSIIARTSRSRRADLRRWFVGRRRSSDIPFCQSQE